MISRDQIKELLAADSDPAVSIYLPTHKAGPAMRKDPIRLKNLLREAEKRIGRAPLSDEILEPAWALVGREREWQHMERGLAIFLTGDGSEILKLPIEPQEAAVVQRGFWLKPLFRVLDDGQRFYLLILDRKDPRLYLCSREGFDRVGGKVMEESFAELVARTEVAADVGYHSASTSGAQGGPGAAKFHSHGESPEDYRKVEVDRFIQGIAKAVDDALKEETAPLAVAGEPEMLGLFRGHCHYGHVLAEAINQAANDEPDDRIYRQALDLVRPVLDAPLKDALGKMERLRNKNPDAVALHHEAILRDAHAGRVETLFLAEDADLWGRLIADDRTKITRTGTEGSVDLIDRMAARTMAHGGTVYVVPRSAIPRESDAAAILRY